MDVFSSPFDYNSFDNLPLSLSIPNTFSTSVPQKVKATSFSLIESDLMAHENLKGLAAKVDKQVQMLRRGTSTTNVLVLVDNFNILANSCDSERPELDVSEFLNHICATSEDDSHVSIAIGANRDLVEADSLTEAFYRELKHSGLFNLVFECSRNLAGHSRDVHGQLNVI